MTVTIHDLQHPDSPAVVAALKRACGLCAAPVGEFCRTIHPKGRLTTLVHLARATAHYREAKGEK